MTKDKKIKFIYFSHSTLQVPRVARQCIVALCEGAAELGTDVELVSYKAKMHYCEPNHLPIKALYGIDTVFKIRQYKLPMVKINDKNKNYWSDFLRLVYYTIHMIKFISRNLSLEYDLVIISARNYSILAMTIIMKKIFFQKYLVIADVHGIPSSKFSYWVYKKTDGNMCISKTLAGTLQENLNLSPIKVHHAHSGVKLERFHIKDDKVELRSKLHLDTNKILLCYTGKVYYRYKEIDYFLEIAKNLNGNAHFVIVGGRPDHVKRWDEERQKKNIENVTFRSFVPPTEIPLYLRASDLLISYYPPMKVNDICSPGKLFEYLASGTPIVAAKFKSTEEIIKDGVNGFLVPPFDPIMFSKKIKEVIRLQNKWDFIGKNAMDTAKNFTWQKRALRFIEYAEILQSNEKKTV